MRKTETFTLKISFDVRGEDRFSGRAQHVRTGEKIAFKDMEVLKGFLLEILRGDPGPRKDPDPSPENVGEQHPLQRRNRP